MKRKVIVGYPIQIPGLIYSPVNEQGVVFLFSKYHKELGIESIECIRNAFPDAIGLRKIGKEVYERINIEFEFKSSGFKEHLKEYKSDEPCIIVCWEHDWEECPKELEVIELKTALPKLLETGKVSEKVKELTERQKEFLEFFDDLLGRLKAKLPNVTQQKALPISYCSIPVGISGIHLEWWIHGHFPKRSLSVDLHFERKREEENKKLFEAFKKQEKDLKKELGDLHFQYPWGKIWARIYQVRSYDATNKEEVEKVKEWAVETMVRFYNIFKPRLDELKPTLNHSYGTSQIHLTSKPAS
ncbi:MAG: DUF4268 domain-containing protein [Nitrososphaerales archaeon]